MSRNPFGQGSIICPVCGEEAVKETDKLDGTIEYKHVNERTLKKKRFCVHGVKDERNSNL